jgi:hypothetical protein
MHYAYSQIAKPLIINLSLLAVVAFYTPSLFEGLTVVKTTMLLFSVFGAV